MREIRAIYHNGDPGFPATDQHPDAIRYVVGPYVVDAIGEAPTQADVDNALNPSKPALLVKLDDDAERVRLRYITPGAGMAMTYNEKFAQAQGVNAIGKDAANAMSAQEREAQFPTLSASVGLEAATLWDCAQLVLQKYAQFAALSLFIERTRLSGKKAISEAPTAAAANAAYEAIKWTP